MVVYQRTSALNFVENYRKYNKYITNGPTAVKEKTSVWGAKVSSCQKHLILLITWRNHTVIFMSCCFVKRRARKAFLFWRVFV